MKHEKSLLIILTIGVFILTSAVVAIVIVTGNSSSSSANGVIAQGRVDIIDNNIDDSNSGAEDSSYEENDPFADNPESDNAVAESGNVEADNSAATSGSSNDSSAASNDSASSSSSKPQDNITVKENKEFGEAKSHAQNSTTTKKPAASSSTTTKSTGSTSTAASTKKPAVKKPVVKTVKEYWVQLGSFGQQERATAIRDELVEKGIPCSITTKDASGKTFFRVRVGPFYTKKEADGTADFLKKDKRFENSYVPAPVLTEKTM
jgi:DedD protein